MFTTPFEAFEFYRDQCSPTTYDLIAVPAGAFLDRVTEVEAQIDKVWAQLEPLVEQYNGVHYQLTQNQAKQAALLKQMGPLQTQVDLAQAVDGLSAKLRVVVELSVRDVGGDGPLRGCGMLVANAPFGFEATARSILQWLWPALSLNGEGGQQVRWICPE